jgi:F-type H+-transporting ATPase subunit b
VIASTLIADSSTKLVLPATNELIWGTVAFVLFLLVLWRAGVWRRLGQAMNERTRRIRTDLERAEKARKEAEALLERYRRQLDEARDEARRIVDEARQAAEQVRKDIQAKAQEESNRIIEGARREIRAERDRAAAELRRGLGTLVVQVTERVIGSELDGDRHLKLIDDYIEELSRDAAAGGQNGGGRGGR